MRYVCDLENGQELHVENDGDQTSIGVGSSSEGQQQSQSNGFQTGKLSGEPLFFRLKKEFILQLSAKDGDRFFRVRGSQVQSLKSAPDLQDAEKLRFRKAAKGAGMKPMEPMKPMRPMKPMEPMKPMRPMKEMRAMRPMEMRMGDMQMSMGGAAARPAAKNFCTQCGQPLAKTDRFCGGCGHEV
ncbi:MAG: hypothetical protein JWQ44_1722 [Chthoniobacter sp.]|jgi:hypothetical protein|nr:hypothetical protein [Chthoniobacter sp.]